jgi:hypothetical protein
MYVNKCYVGGNEGMGNWRKGGAAGSRLRARDQQGWGSSTKDNEPTFQVRGFSFTHKHMPYVSNMYLCVIDKKKRFLCAG